MKPSSASLWFAGVIVALFAGAHFLIVRPADQRREFLQHDIAQKHAALASFDRTAESVGIFGGRIEGMRPPVAVFEARLNSGGEMNKVLEELWRLAEANGLQTKTVKTPPDKRTDHFREQEIEMSLSGNFGGYYEFLLKLENMKRIVRIRKMNVKKTPARNGHVQAELTLSVFSAPGPL